jgi:AbiV family abortive infection protein
MRKALLLMVLALAASAPAFADSIHLNNGGSFFGYSGSYLYGDAPSMNGGWMWFEVYNQSASGKFANGWLEEYDGNSWLYGNLTKSFFNSKTDILTGQFNGWQESWKSGNYTFSYVSGAFTERLYPQYNGGGWSYGTMGNGYLHGGTTVPEPSSLVFTGTGLAGLAGLVRRKLRRPLSVAGLGGLDRRSAPRRVGFKDRTGRGIVFQPRVEGVQWNNRFAMKFLALYNASLNNATDLLAESEILFNTERYARAYALAFTALEEISKSQLAADVFTGLITDEEFQECCRDHRKKIDRMAWATEDAKRYLAMPEANYIAISEPAFTGRMDAMYVGSKGEKVVSPSDVIGRDAARSIIHTAQVAIQHIIEMTEFWGHEIGTKGFMKQKVERLWIGLQPCTQDARQAEPAVVV